eukprot:scaffold16296_cov63-Phaeocystis_antarctica.AAC.3
MITTCAPSPYQPRAQRAMRRRHRSGFGLFGEGKRPQKLQPAGEQQRSKCAFGLPQALVRKHTPGSRTGAHGRNR